MASSFIRAPLDTDNLLACGATHSRLEGALSSRDIYRMARALVLQFIAGYSCAPASITLDLNHTDDATYGQQALSFYNHHSAIIATCHYWCSRPTQAPW